MAFQFDICLIFEDLIWSEISFQSSMIKTFYTINVILLSLGKTASKNSPNPWWMAPKPGGKQY